MRRIPEHERGHCQTKQLKRNKKRVHLKLYSAVSSLSHETEVAIAFHALFPWVAFFSNLEQGRFLSVPDDYFSQLRRL